MKAVQISKPGGDFELVERPIPQPARGEVRIKVEACGICRSDALVEEGQWPGLQYPRVPGHEIAGRVDAPGALMLLRGHQRSASASVGMEGIVSVVNRAVAVTFSTVRTRKLPPSILMEASRNTRSFLPKRWP